jgi:hypothetical protein
VSFGPDPLSANVLPEPEDVRRYAVLFAGADPEHVEVIREAFENGCLGGWMEVRLADDEPRVDFGVCVDRDQAVHARQTDVGSFWGAVLDAWIHPKSEPWRRVNRLSIEFDGRESGCTAETGIWGTAFPFFDVSQLVRRGESRQALEPLFDVLAPWAPWVERAAFDGPASLPSGARVLHVGAQNHRGVGEIRMQASAGTEETLRWLATAAQGVCQAGATAARALLEGLPLHVVAVQAVSRDGEFEPYAVEITHAHGPQGDPIWRALLKRAVALRLACAEKAEALLRWPVPAPSARHVPFPSAPRTFHVALRCTGDVQLKAYAHRWSPASA